MAQITSSTTSVSPTVGDAWVNLPLNPQKVIRAYKTTSRINDQDTTDYPAIRFLVDFSFKVKDALDITENNYQTWIYASGDTVTRDADFLIVNSAIGGDAGGGRWCCPCACTYRPYR